MMRSKSRLICMGLFLGWLWMPLGSHADAQRVAAPKADVLATIPRKMQEFVDQGEVSGIVTLVATRDATVHLTAVGKSDLASGRELKTDDLFWIASMTKPIVGVAIAMLVDDGKLTFDDPVSKHLPEYAQLKVGGGGRGGRGQAAPLTDVARPITLRDLLTHTSGMGELRNREPHLTLAETSQRVATQPLLFQPGARWQYSTAGIDVLGRVAEVVSGQTFDKFLQERLFTPLGMKNTTFWLTEEQQTRFVTNYAKNGNQLVPAQIDYLYGTANTDRQRAPLGGAGLFSTAEDLGRFYQMILRGGEWAGKRYLREATVKEMLTKQTGSLQARPGMPWGLGFCVVEDPQQLAANKMLAPNSYGHGGAHGTSSWNDPAKGAVYIIMLQRKGLNNPDNSDMHRVFQEVANAAFE